MSTSTLALPDLDWTDLAHRLDDDGVAVTPPLLSAAECAELVAMFDEDDRFRSTVVMARHAFGEGSYRYFADPLPPLVQTLRTELYPPIARIANAWAERLGEPTYPDTLDGLLDRCARAGQTKPTPLVLRYGPGGYNCLHQDVYGDLTFPLQFLVMLSRPDVDFTGGESVFVEQRPRQQSRPIVLRPAPGPGRGLPRSPPPAPGHARRPPRAGAPRRQRRAHRRAPRPGRDLPQRALGAAAQQAARASRRRALTDGAAAAEGQVERGPQLLLRPVGRRGPPGHVPVRADQHGAVPPDVDHRERRTARDPVGRGPPRRRRPDRSAA